VSLGETLSALDSRWFSALLAAVAAERVFEVWLSLRNTRRALERGGVEYGRDHYPWMVALHSSFFVACLLEVGVLDRPFRPVLAAPCLLLVALTMALRYWAVLSLGDRWNTRVVCEPGVPAVTAGPYRFLRHPNYLAVTIELAALPLVHGAWITAVLYSLLNAWMLHVRIGVEEAALSEHSDYRRLFALDGRSSRGA